MTRRVVITGMGMNSPIGNSVEESFSALLRGEHGIRFMPEWDIMPDLQGRLGAIVDNLDLKKALPRKKRRTMGRVAMLAAHACEQAVAQSGLSAEELATSDVGVAFGSTTGSSTETEKFCLPIMTERTMKGLESASYIRMMTHTCAANIAALYGASGRVESTCTACTSASQAIGRGFELIRNGQQKVMIVGGAEEMHYTTAVTFDLLMATSFKYNDKPALSPRPFDQSRDGLVIGEGAGALILEDYEHAKARGAKILAEIRGYASNCGGVNMTAPSVDAMRDVMNASLTDAGLKADEVDYVCAHATGTEVGDIAESKATEEVFSRKVPCSSLKSYVGHTLGACGAIEAIWCVEMMRRDKLIPTRNLQEVDSRCGALDYIQDVRNQQSSLIMNNNFAFGGINTSMILTRI